MLAYVRQILSAEVLDKELGEIHLLGLDSAGLRYESHHIKEIYGHSASDAGIQNGSDMYRSE